MQYLKRPLLGRDRWMSGSINVELGLPWESWEGGGGRGRGVRVAK